MSIQLIIALTSLIYAIKAQKCPVDNVNIPKSDSCTDYYNCSSNPGTPVLMGCPEGQYFHCMNQECGTATFSYCCLDDPRVSTYPESTSCNIPAYAIEYIGHCDMYVGCVYGSIWALRCDPGTYFSSYNHSCYADTGLCPTTTTLTSTTGTSTISDVSTTFSSTSISSDSPTTTSEDTTSTSTTSVVSTTSDSTDISSSTTTTTPESTTTTSTTSDPSTTSSSTSSSSDSTTTTPESTSTTSTTSDPSTTSSSTSTSSDSTTTRPESTSTTSTTSEPSTTSSSTSASSDSTTTTPESTSTASTTSEPSTSSSSTSTSSDSTTTTPETTNTTSTTSDSSTTSSSISTSSDSTTTTPRSTTITSTTSTTTISESNITSSSSDSTNTTPVVGQGSTTTAAPAICSEGAKANNADFCNMYYECSGGSVKSKFCPFFKKYNCWSGKCQFRGTAHCCKSIGFWRSHKCETGKTIPDPRSCTSYYTCQNNKSVKKYCDNGYVYDVWQHNCQLPTKGKCAKNPSITVCKAYKSGLLHHNSVDSATLAQC